MSDIKSDTSPDRIVAAVSRAVTAVGGGSDGHRAGPGLLQQRKCAGARVAHADLGVALETLSKISQCAVIRVAESKFLLGTAVARECGSMLFGISQVIRPDPALLNQVMQSEP